MSVEWSRICASFTKEEILVIQKVQNHLNLNKNQFARRCMKTGVVTVLLDRLLRSKKTGLPQVARPIVSEIFPRKRIEQINKKLEKVMKKIPHDVRKAAEEEAKLLNEVIQVFSKHNPVGAPSQKPRKRSRPKDTGYER